MEQESFTDKFSDSTFQQSKFYRTMVVVVVSRYFRWQNHFGHEKILSIIRRAPWEPGHNVY